MSNNTSTIVFIDSNVADYQTLAQGVSSDAEVIVLDKERDGIEQITEALAHRSDVASVQIVSHGDAGRVQLGSSWLSADTLSQYSQDLSQWGDALQADGDIFFLGCNIAGDNSNLIQHISRLTKADVAASDDLTGNHELGGDWILETTIGSVDAPLAFKIDALSAFNSTLQTFTVTNTNDSGSGSLRDAIEDAESNNNSSTQDIIDLSAIAGGTITLSDSLPTITQGLEIQGNNVTINGLKEVGSLDTYSQIFAINTDAQVNLFDLNLTRGAARGGDGSTGGGGGLGAGGALFINQGQVVVDNVAFNLNFAIGGDSNSDAGAGGGEESSGGNGGAGGGLNSGALELSSTNSIIEYNASSFTTSGADGGDGGKVTDGDDDGVNGTDSSTFGAGGGAGGGGGGEEADGNDVGGDGGDGGSGGYGAGGGGAGGGGADTDTLGFISNGSEPGSGGTGGTGGTYGGNGEDGSNGGGSGGSGGQGGGGAGLGGAIFVNENAELTILNSSFFSNFVNSGSGNEAGDALGSNLFVRNNGTAALANVSGFGSYYEESSDGITSLTLPTVSISTDSSAISETEDDTNPENGKFELTLSNTLEIDFDIDYTVSGTATNGTDYETLSGSVTVDADSSSASIPINVIDDAIYEGSETVTVTLQDSNYYDVSSSNGAATHTISDNEPVISVTASNDAIEGGDNGEFTFSLSPTVLDDNRNLSFQITGTNDTNAATEGDYRLLAEDGTPLASDSSGNYFINISNESTVTVQVDATGNAAENLNYDDNIDEADETVQITLIDVNDGNPVTYGDDGNDNNNQYAIADGTATLSIIDNDVPPTISVAAGTNPEEPDVTGTFDLSLSSEVLSGGATVDYSISDNSTATFSDDYTLISNIDGSETTLNSTSGELEISEGTDSNSTIQIKVVPANDNIADPGETVILELSNGSGATVDSNNDSATLTITDDDVIPVASLSSTQATVEEGGLLSFTISLDSPALSGGATVNYEIINFSSATEGVDFNGISGTATIAEGKQEAVVTITTLEDFEEEGIETLYIDLLDSGTGYDVASDNDRVVLRITDNDTAGITINPLTGNTTEAGGQAFFEAVLDSQPTHEVTLSLTSSDTTEGAVSADSLSFDASNWNQTQTFTVTGVDDAIADGNVGYSIVTSSDSIDESYDSTVIEVDDVSLTNTDNDVAAVLVTASGGSTEVAEGGTTDSYTLALSQTPTGNH